MTGFCAKYLGIVVLTTLATPVFAQDYSVPLSEQDLRSLVPFSADAKLKLTECGKKTYPTCTYIWGLPDSDDEARIKLGGMPAGDKLLTIFAQARSPQDFSRVLGSYKDAVPVDGLGVTAVWSGRRNQLSLITDENLIIHVNVQIWKLDDPKPTALQVAAFLLASR